MNWSVWRLDIFTWAWIVWLVFFVIVETLALVQGNRQELTEHLRPLFLANPLTWFLAAGLWLWVGFHFLLEVDTPFSRL